MEEQVVKALNLRSITGNEREKKVPNVLILQKVKYRSLEKFFMQLKKKKLTNPNSHEERNRVNMRPPSFLFFDQNKKLKRVLKMQINYGK